MMESRAWGANRLHDPKGPSLLSALPHAGLTGSHPRESAVRQEGLVRHLLGLRVPLERTLIAPDTPGDASHAIGEGDGCDVMASGLGGSDGPSLELIGFMDAVSSEKG